MKRIIRFFIIFAVVVMAAAGVYLGYFSLESTPPVIRIETSPETVGRDFLLAVDVEDSRSGIRTVAVSLVQGEKTVDLEPEVYQMIDWWSGTGVHQVSLQWDIRPMELGLSGGEAMLRVTATDASLKNGFRGNRRVWEREIIIDITPPVIAVKSLVHNIRIGGAGLVSYRVSEPVVKTGVWVDDLFFPAYEKKGGGEGFYTSLLALPYLGGKPERIFIEAIDRAGNSVKTGFPHRVLPRARKVDRINISDGFLKRKMPDFMVRYPEFTGSLKAVFLQINRELRQKNNEEISGYCKKSVSEILWEGRFLTLPRSAFMAGFGDERHYFYKGRKIDKAYHMGTDHASVAHAKVPAANTGTVVFTGYIGIYGNSVIIDHGQGLFSLYSHLNDIMISSGEHVKKGDIIGLTGMTGLAGGDHLHFGMLINGVFVDPREWWDNKWIQDHILANIGGE